MIMIAMSSVYRTPSLTNNILIRMLSETTRSGIVDLIVMSREDKINR